MRRQTVDPRIRSKVIATWGNRCWLGMPGCSITATEDDHIIPFSMAERTPWRTCAAPASTATRCARTACCQDTARRCMSSSDRHEPTSAWPCSPCSAVTASWSASTACCATCARRNPKQAMAPPRRRDGMGRCGTHIGQKLRAVGCVAGAHTATLPPPSRHAIGMDSTGLRCACHRDAGIRNVRARPLAPGVSDGAAMVLAAPHAAGGGCPHGRETQRLAALGLRHGDDTARPRW